MSLRYLCFRRKRRNFLRMNVFVEGRITLKDLTDNTNYKVRSKDPTKRTSFAEKLHHVKNKQSERYLNVLQCKIAREHDLESRKLRLSTNDMSYDYKGIKMSIKKREVELKKELDPDCDVEEEEYEIAQQQKYLVYDPNKWFYLDRKNTYPLRNSAQGKSNFITPTLAKARRLLEDINNHRRVRALRNSSANPGRKSAPIVHFQQDPAADDLSQDGSMSQPSAPSPQRQPSAASSRARLSRASKTPVEDMLVRLRREKLNQNQQTIYSAVLGSNKDTDRMNDMPDDYTQCHPVREKSADKRQAVSFQRHTPSRINYEDYDDDDDETSTYLQSIAGELGQRRPTASAVSRGGASMVSRTTLPNVEEDLPRHELHLLSASPTKRFVMSATVGGRGPQYGASALRSQSFRSSRQRAASTHAAIRQEKVQVQQKVAAFLGALDRENSRNKEKQRLESPPGVQDLAKQKQAELMLTATKSAGLPMEASKTSHALKSGIPQKNATSTMENTSDQKPAPKKGLRGIPNHSVSRSNRSGIAFKLQKMIKAFRDNCTTQERMEMEKLKQKIRQENASASQADQ